MSASRLPALSVLVFGGGRSLGDLADAEWVSSATMSRLVSGLEDQGLVRREPDPEDARAVVTEATEKGRRLLEEGRDRRVAGIAALLGELSADRLDAVARAAEILDGVLDGADPAGSRD